MHSKHNNTRLGFWILCRLVLVGSQDAALWVFRWLRLYKKVLWRDQVQFCWHLRWRLVRLQWRNFVVLGRNLRKFVVLLQTLHPGDPAILNDRFWMELCVHHQRRLARLKWSEFVVQTLTNRDAAFVYEDRDPTFLNEASTSRLNTRMTQVDIWTQHRTQYAETTYEQCCRSTNTFKH